MVIVFVVPSDPHITATSNMKLTSFILTLKHPKICVTNYNLIIKENMRIIYNSTFKRSDLKEDNLFDLKDIEASLNVNPCRYTYTFALKPHYIASSSIEQKGNVNYDCKFIMQSNLIV